MIQEAKKKKHNMPKNVVAAINKANRDEDIKNHGKPCEMKGKKSENPKAYKRSKNKGFEMDENVITRNDIMAMVNECIKRIISAKMK